MMNTFEIILFFGAIILISIIIAKIYFKLAFKADDAIDNIICKKGTADSHMLISTIFAFETTASIKDSMAAVENHVSLISGPPASGYGDTYLSSRDNNTFYYVNGNQIIGDVFKGKIVFQDNGGKTVARFWFTDWVLSKGKPARLDSMKKLLSEIQEGFRQLDPSVKMTSYTK